MSQKHFLIRLCRKRWLPILNTTIGSKKRISKVNGHTVEKEWKVCSNIDAVQSVVKRGSINPCVNLCVINFKPRARILNAGTGVIDNYETRHEMTVEKAQALRATAASILLKYCEALIVMAPMQWFFLHSIGDGGLGQVMMDSGSVVPVKWSTCLSNQVPQRAVSQAAHTRSPLPVLAFFLAILLLSTRPRFLNLKFLTLRNRY